MLALNQLITSNPPNFLIVYHAKCSEVNYKIVRKFQEGILNFLIIP